MRDEGISGVPQLTCFLFTMWGLDSGCENPFSLGSDKGEGVAGFSTDAKSCQPGHPDGLNVLVTHSC